MRLFDRISQCRSPFIVRDNITLAHTRLNGAAEFARVIAQCPIRYVLRDDLTRLCTSLAYSKGSGMANCADLLHVPAELAWIEWCEAAWQGELGKYGFPVTGIAPSEFGRRGALVRSSSDGRRGLVRTFWAGRGEEAEVLASSMEAYFDFDTPEGGDPQPFDSQVMPEYSVADYALDGSDMLRRCVRFRYERTWNNYYLSAVLSPDQKAAVAKHSLGCIAVDVPVLMAFFLLLATRSGLPQRSQSMLRLNRARPNGGSAPLLDHIEVLAPILPSEDHLTESGQGGCRRGPRLHYVRGHLVRRADQLFWRMPHLRGNAKLGRVRSRTVTWSFDTSAAQHSPSGSRQVPADPPHLGK